jgi:hypothetical protein
MRETLKIIARSVKAKTILQNLSQYVNDPKILQTLMGFTGETHFKDPKEPA